MEWKVHSNPRASGTLEWRNGALAHPVCGNAKHNVCPSKNGSGFVETGAAGMTHGLMCK